MSDAPPRKPMEDIIIELVRFEFKWIPGSDDSNIKTGDVIAKITVEPSTDDNTLISGFCELEIIRHKYKFDNFSITSRYYYSFPINNSHSRSRKAWETNLAKSIIWTRFAELARMAAVNAGSNPYDIPLSPGKIQYSK